MVKRGSAEAGKDFEGVYRRFAGALLMLENY